MEPPSLFVDDGSLCFTTAEQIPEGDDSVRIMAVAE
jgi:hypothetical protein